MKDVIVLKTTTDSRTYNRICLKKRFPIYYDEGWGYYYPKGYKRKKKFLLPYQVRMYKTWKHNRNTQWKPK